MRQKHHQRSCQMLLFLLNKIRWLLWDRNLHKNEKKASLKVARSRWSCVDDALFVLIKQHTQNAKDLSMGRVYTNWTVLMSRFFADSLKLITMALPSFRVQFPWFIHMYARDVNSHINDSACYLESTTRLNWRHTTIKTASHDVHVENIFFYLAKLF